MSHHQKFLLVAFIALLGSCSAEKPAQQPAAGGSPASAGVPVPSAPDAGLELSPRDPDRRSVLQVMARGFDPSRAGLRWLLNGSPAASGNNPRQFDCSLAAKGSTVQAVATVQGQEVLSNIVEIRNTRPEVLNVRFLQETAAAGGTLTVAADTNDIDDDPVTILYAWKRNDAPAGNSANMAGQTMRGDKLTVTVTPFDGQNYGAPVTLSTEVRNLPPSFVDHKNFSFVGGRYTYQARAADPDGDAVSYSLLNAPEGMTIDRATGTLSWSVPPEFKGQESVTIVAEDGHGGTGRYSIDIFITP